MLAAPAVSQAQQAYCDCCREIYTVPGATWIGASRQYGGICPKCRVEGKCPDCRERADELRRDYETWNQIRSRAGLTNSANRQLDHIIDRARQRWSDLRYTCLAVGGRDIGRLNSGTADRPPSRGLTTPATKQRLRDQAQQAVSQFDDILYDFDFVYGDDPSNRQVGFEALRERARTAELLNRLANDPLPTPTK
ncbi:MAG TPA: hypothetical protein VM533_12510 [Fimbriiglobus sp.]|jgi:hypothetical protein|nr:hypothetical protein [Fimbriiglobus sp.]